jgi:hypothetical protein
MMLVDTEMDYFIRWLGVFQQQELEVRVCACVCLVCLFSTCIFACLFVCSQLVLAEKQVGPTWAAVKASENSGL